MGPKPEKPNTPLIMAICSIALAFCCGFPGALVGLGLAVYAIILARKYQARMQEWNMEPESTATIAIIIAVVGIVFAFLVFAWNVYIMTHPEFMQEMFDRLERFARP